MDQHIELNPDGLRAAAADFDDVTDWLGKIRKILEDSTGALGEAWGHDKAGKKFADGPKGYKAGRDNSFKSLSQLADVLEQNANNLRDAAKVFEENERAQSR
ncbi:WXG100 family type VII secretion target [Nocardia pseudobrasiliensis]|uniref:Uncharacterized protein YukE n=1 Tax=Nocardia pseudobrasiliensis TaxID=45979 RepID=A0A370IC77_9NOCA|nr:WXG100 family type VII secretion target [Nocardia pseudobrasiliensis]RDI68220.1 uncharacterized protein YukE [Nocardia pseudobrasiliensis]